MSADTVSCFWSLMSPNNQEFYFISNLNYNVPNLKYLIHPSDLNHAVKDIPEFVSPKAFYGSQGRFRVRTKMNVENYRMLEDDYQLYNITFHTITMDLVLCFFHADQAHAPSGYVQCTHPRMQTEYISRLRSCLRSIPNSHGPPHTNPFSSPNSNPPPGPPVFSPHTPNGSTSQYNPGKAGHATRHLLIFDPSKLDFTLSYSQQLPHYNHGAESYSPTIGHLPQLSQKIKSMEDKLHVQFNSVFQVNQNYKMEYFIHFDGKMAICCVQMDYSAINSPSNNHSYYVKEENSNSYFKQLPPALSAPGGSHNSHSRYPRSAATYPPATVKAAPMPSHHRSQHTASFASYLPSAPSMDLTLPSQSQHSDDSQSPSKMIRLPPITEFATIAHLRSAPLKASLPPIHRPSALPKSRPSDHNSFLSRTHYPYVSSRKDITPNCQRCENCGTTNSPEWRRGPSGEKTLCNACGLRYSRLKAKALKYQNSVNGPKTTSSHQLIHSNTNNNHSNRSIKDNGSTHSINHQIINGRKNL